MEELRADELAKEVDVCDKGVFRRKSSPKVRSSGIPLVALAPVKTN